MPNSEGNASRDFQDISNQQDIKEGDTFKDYNSFETFVKSYSKDK